jgi:hypothetical protein
MSQTRIRPSRRVVRVLAGGGTRSFAQLASSVVAATPSTMRVAFPIRYC